MEIDVRANGLMVEARFDNFKIVTDQPEDDGGTNTAPSPFDLFLASLATCAGYYVLAFCQERALPTEGLALKMTSDWNEHTHLVENIGLDIVLPHGFPAKYRRAVMRVAGMCTVKRHLENPPVFKVSARNGRPE
jgi:ribosomal protein S12 methylthiotransferase accessory factor